MPLTLEQGSAVWIEGHGETPFERGTLTSKPSADTISVELSQHVEKQPLARAALLECAACFLSLAHSEAARLRRLSLSSPHTLTHTHASACDRLEGSGAIIEARADKVTVEQFGERLLLLISSSMDALGPPPDALPPVPPLDNFDSFGERTAPSSDPTAQEPWPGQPCSRPCPCP